MLGNDRKEKKKINIFIPPQTALGFGSFYAAKNWSFRKRMRWEVIKSVKINPGKLISKNSQLEDFNFSDCVIHLKTTSVTALY